MSIGENIRRLRTERGWTQDQLAEKLDVTFQAVSSWERDEHSPELDKAVRLAELFGVSLSAVVEDRIGAFKTKKALYDWQHMTKAEIRQALKGELIAYDHLDPII